MQGFHFRDHAMPLNKLLYEHYLGERTKVISIDVLYADSLPIVVRQSSFRNNNNAVLHVGKLHEVSRLY